MAILRLLLAALLVWLAGPALASAQGMLGKRLALVIGNSNYQSVYSLKNAVNDSMAVANALEALGFEVKLLNDATHDQIEAAIAAMAEQAKAEDAQATLLYYSGHGFQLSGANYIVPVDAVLNDREKIDEQTIRLDGIIATLESNDRQTIILLDACRDNPLPPSLRDKDARNGLAEVRTGVNTYIAFATAPGAVSLDGKGGQGPFAEAFVRNVSMPDVSVSDMMSVVRTSVRAQTKGMQLPWENNTLFSPFYFNPGTFDPTQAAVLLGPAPRPPADPAAGTATPIEVATADPRPLAPATTAPVANPNSIAAPPVVPSPFGGTVVAVTPSQPVVVGQPVEPPSQDVADIPSESRSVSEPETVPVVTTPSTTQTQLASGAETPVAPGTGTQVQPGSDTQVAALNPSVPHLTPLDEQPQVVVGTEVSPEGEVPAAPVTPIPQEPVDLALAVQEELKRVGCYTGRLDGDWGQGSRAALKKFLDGVQEASIEASEPTAQVLALIKTRNAIVCDRTVVATPQPTKPPKAPTTTKPPKAAGTQPASTPKPAQAEVTVDPGKMKFSPGIGSFR